VVGRSVPADFPAPDGVRVLSVGRVAGFRPEALTGSARPDPAQARTEAPAPVRAARWLLLPEHRARVEAAWCRDAARLLRDEPAPDVVHAHDFNTLALGARLADGWAARLVFDSHELWRGRERHGRPEPVRRARQARTEDALLRRADAVITVSGGIAEILRRRGARTVVVVRNSFPSSDPLLAPDQDDASPATPAGLVYAGRIARGRDLETVLAAQALLGPQLRTVVVGGADQAYLGSLDLPEGVDLRPRSVSLPEVDSLYRELGIGLVTLTNTCANHRLALPNKLFHALSAGVPVVVSDLPEMAGFVRRMKVGAVYRSGDAQSLARAVRTVRDDYAAMRARVAAALRTGELSWAHDAAVLVGLYANLARAATRTPGRKVAMLVRNGVRNDSRVRKSAVALTDAGYDVSVLGTGPPGGAEAFVLDGVPVRLVDLPRPGAGPSRVAVLLGMATRRGGWRRLNPWLLDLDLAWRPLLEELTPDVVHAHDAHPVPAAAEYVRGRRLDGHAARWVYDAHEDAERSADRGTGGLRGWLRRRMVGGMLRELVPQADAVLTVSEELAGDLQARYRLRRRPVVVLNAPVSRGEETSPGAPGEPAAPSVRCAVGLAAGVPLLVHVGGLTPARGLFTVITGMDLLPGVHLALVARGDDPDLQGLLDLADTLGVRDRVHVAPYVAPSLVTTYLHSCDAGVVAILHRPNHEISLITKYLEYVQSRLPLVVSDVRTMAATTRRYGWGEVFRAGDADAFAQAARTVLARPEKYAAAYREHPDVLAELTWEASARRLVAAYDDVVQQRPPRSSRPAVAS
jgi:glycosyltransferase involved in cell wall biosynthesis